MILLNYQAGNMWHFNRNRMNIILWNVYGERLSSLGALVNQYVTKNRLFCELPPTWNLSIKRKTTPIHDFSLLIFFCLERRRLGSSLSCTRATPWSPSGGSQRTEISECTCPVLDAQSHLLCYFVRPYMFVSYDKGL